MKHLRSGVAIALLALGSAVQAAPSFAVGGNTVFFNNWENLYRPVANCGALAPCLAAVAGDPAGFQRVDTSIAGNIALGDVFAGVLNVQNIQSQVSGFDVYNSTPGNRFTGYFAQEVKAIDPTTITATILTLGTPTVDPFGKLAAGETMRLWSDVAAFTSGGSATDVTTSLTSATTGTFWAGLGLGGEGYTYTRTDLTTPVTDTNTESFLALDLITIGPGYNAGLLEKVNDFNESLVGGTIASPLVCSAAEIATPGISCTDFVGTAEIEQNTEFGLGNSPWIYASNDPFRLGVIPEPGSVALGGLALLALGAARRRKS